MSALGPRFGEEGSSSEAVDFQGVQSAIEAAEAFLEQGDGSSAAPGDEERVLVAPGDSGSDGRGPGGGSFELPQKPMGAPFSFSRINPFESSGILTFVVAFLLPSEAC